MNVSAKLADVNLDEERPSASPRFVTTQWNVILSAARTGAAQMGALEQLCRAYWYPLYAYVRRRGHGPEDAQDLTQEFFARLLKKNWLAEIEPEGGRFRSFLLTMLNRFLANAYDHATAAKRGGSRVLISLDDQDAEERYALEPATDETPERIFDRRWSLAVLDQALTRLQEEIVAAGKRSHYELLHPFLSREPDDGDYAAVGTQLGVSAGAVGVSVFRLRQRYREVLRTTVAETLADPTQIDDEMNHLFAALRE